MHAAVHARLRAIEPGRADATVPAPPDGLDAALWLLADFVSGVALSGTIAAGERITTLRLTLHVLTRTDVTGPLHAVGRLDERARDVGLSTAVITDGAGRTVARAQARNAVLADDVAAGPRTATATWPATPRTPHDLVREGAAPDPVSVNAAAVVQGGVLAALPARALADLLGGPADEASATFLRAVPTDGRSVHTETELEHGGRRLRSGRALLRDDRDRTVLSLTGLRYAGA